MAGADDLFVEAVAELYSCDPAEFVDRRGSLVAGARAAGQAPAAKRIAGLRKPTRAAWVVNQLVRAAPGVPAELARLGEDLRAAQRSLDGTSIRELSLRRRQLIEDLARRAFAVSGQRSAPAGLRDEVFATLGAALADQQVAERLAAGTLERAARSQGFGSEGSAPTLVTASSGGRRSGRGPGARPANRAAASPWAAAKKPEQPAGWAAGERERRRQAARAAAEQAAAEAGRAAEAATAAEREQETAVQFLEEQLADARRSLSQARITARRARTQLGQARQALGRLQGRTARK